MLFIAKHGREKMLTTAILGISGKLCAVLSVSRGPQAGKLWTEITSAICLPAGKLWTETLVNFALK
jgi:hypothetical protein